MRKFRFRIVLVFLGILLFAISNYNKGSKYSGLNFRREDFDLVLQFNRLDTSFFLDYEDSTISFIRVNDMYNYNKKDTLFNTLKGFGIDLESFYNSIDYSIQTPKPRGIYKNLTPYKYNKNKYILFHRVIIDNIYNEIQFNKSEQNQKVTRDYSIELIKHLHKYFKSIDILDGYILIIQWGSKNFLKEDSLPDSHFLCYISPKSEVEKLAKYEISVQDFLNNIKILAFNGYSGDANRIDINF